MKNFGNKHYFSRAQTKSMSIDHPIGDPFGGTAYGEKNDPVTATVGAGLIGGVGSYLGGRQAAKASAAQSAAQLEAARLGAEQAAFRPVGVTTGFGSSQFAMGPDGRLQSAGYTLTPEMQRYQQSMMGMAGQGLQQYEGGQAAAQPLFQGAQTAMNLGQGYLQQDPQAQAAQYMAQQQALLAPQRAQQEASMQTGMFNRGRMGLGVGATAQGMGNSNPEYQAMLNAQMMQDLALAAQAQQGGQQNAQFGAGMLNQGATGLQNYYGAQVNAMNPYNAAMGGAQSIEGLGQQSLEFGRVLGAGNQQSGSLLAQGGQNAANSMFNANAWSPVGTALSGAGNMLGNLQFPASTTAAGPMNQYSDASTWGGMGPGENYSGY